MKINRKFIRKVKRLFNLYNIAILACIIIILISLFIIFRPNLGKIGSTADSNIELVDTEIRGEDEITEEQARKVAVKQFKKLGEKKVKQEDLNVKKILRSQEEYYYISSAENTLEIKIKGGTITRINSAVVNE